MIYLKQLLLIPLLKHLSKIASLLCGALIVGLRPILGPALCKFEPTCTTYAMNCLAQYPLHKALWQIAKRLLKCNPLY